MATFAGLPQTVFNLVEANPEIPPAPIAQDAKSQVILDEVQPRNGSFIDAQVGATNTRTFSHVRRTYTNRDTLDGRGPGYYWFEYLHIFPATAQELGNVVSDQQIDIDLYNAYRETPQSLTDITNGLSAQGVTVGGAPSLPATHVQQTSIALTLDIDDIGPPAIDGTVTFTYGVQTLELDVTGTRIILFEFVPEAGVRERLRWKTDILTASDGTERRTQLRAYPRQGIEYEVIPARQRDVTRLQHLVSEWAPRIFGVPMWWWLRDLTTGVSAGADNVTIVSADDADFRVGNLVLIAQDDGDGGLVTDVVEIASISSPLTPATLTFSSNLLNSYTLGAFAVPMVACTLDVPVQISRARRNFTRASLRFTSTENVLDIADTAGFTTHRGKIVLDGPNYIDGDYTQQIEHTPIRVDFDIGPVQAFGRRTIGAETLPKRFRAETAAEEWTIRKLLYALRGRQVSFYLPSGQPDLELVANALSGSSTIDVADTGYGQNQQNRFPKQDIRILRNNGTQTLHQIVGSTVVGNAERLTIDPALAADLNTTDVDRIDFLVLSRLATDDAEIVHNYISRNGDAIDTDVVVATKGVQNT
jgi:hypothetical protein